MTLRRLRLTLTLVDANTDLTRQEIHRRFTPPAPDLGLGSLSIPLAFDEPNIITF
jgi:hypothetical protein